MSGSRAQTNPTAQSLKKVPDKNVRLIFSCQYKKAGDNNTFDQVAKNLKRDYDKRDAKHEVLIVKVTSGKELVEIINAYGKDTIRSVDILSHSNSENAYISDGPKEKHLRQSIPFYRIYEWEIFSDKRELDDIKFDRFTNNGKVEMHGCKSSSETELDDNIIRQISIELFNAGKMKSCAIGHGRKGNPNINGTQDPMKMDYRHGRRFIYHNGRVLLYKNVPQQRYTLEQGHLDESAIEANIP